MKTNIIQQNKPLLCPIWSCGAHPFGLATHEEKNLRWIQWMNFQSKLMTIVTSMLFYVTNNDLQQSNYASVLYNDPNIQQVTYFIDKIHTILWQTTVPWKLNDQQINTTVPTTTNTRKTSQDAFYYSKNIKINAYIIT